MHAQVVTSYGPAKGSTTRLPHHRNHYPAAIIYCTSCSKKTFPARWRYRHPLLPIRTLPVLLASVDVYGHVSRGIGPQPRLAPPPARNHPAAEWEPHDRISAKLPTQDSYAPSNPEPRILALVAMGAKLSVRSRRLLQWHMTSVGVYIYIYIYVYIYIYIYMLPQPPRISERTRPQIIYCHKKYSLANIYNMCKQLISI